MSIQEIKNNRNCSFVKFYFIGLFLFLSFVYFPSFFYPVRSDYWSTAYFFHRVYSMPTFDKWVHIFLYDPWSHIRFQPFAYLILYYQWLFFGSNFIFFSIFNFCLYFLSLVLLYKFVMIFCKNKYPAILFITVFAFLFSHFDIICWQYHSYIIMGFCLIISAFLLYAKFIETGRIINFIFTIICFLSGILCYEAYVLFPLGIIIFHDLYGDNFKKFKFIINKTSLLSIGVIYFIYILLFVLMKYFNIYEQPLTSINELFSINYFTLSFFGVWFNMIYNGFFVNVLPVLFVPVDVDSNINLGGIVRFYTDSLVLVKYVYVCGGVIFFGVACFMYRLFKVKNFKLFKILILFLFLYFSEFFILFFFRLATNTPGFVLTQFRYMYIPNAILALIIVVLVDNLFKPTRRRNILIFIIAVFIMVSNVYVVRRYGISVLNDNLRPLSCLLSNVKKGLSEGIINEKDKLFLDDSIVSHELSSLCWNKEMGDLFMKRTYQWVFSPKYINCFSEYRDQAKWIVNKDELSIIGNR